MTIGHQQCVNVFKVGGAGGWGADEAPCKQKWATLVFISFGSHAVLKKKKKKCPPAVSQSSRLLSVSML